MILEEPEEPEEHLLFTTLKEHLLTLDVVLAPSAGRMCFLFTAESTEF